MANEEAFFWFLGVMGVVVLFFIIAFGGDSMDGYD